MCQSAARQTGTKEKNVAIGKQGEKLYAKRDHEAQGDAYIKHVSAMTGEGLHLKSAIAAELAHRDLRIAELEARLPKNARQMHAYILPQSAGGGRSESCIHCGHTALDGSLYCNDSGKN